MPLRILAALALAMGLSSPALAQSLVQGRVNTGTSSYTTDQYAPLQLDATGALKMTEADVSVPTGSPFSATSVSVLFSVETTGYQSLAVQIAGTFAGTVTYEASNDNSTWSLVVGYQPGNSGVTIPSAFDVSPSLRVFPLVGRYFRARVSGYTSGTITAAPVLRREAIAPIGVHATIVPYRTTGTNRSATVATTASVLMASNINRQGWKIKNDCANAVWINFDATAAATAGSGNIKIAAGAYLASEPGFVETGAMSAIAETASCTLTAREH